MLGNYPFSNYEEFKELFVREDNGQRKNGVLLKFVRSKEVREYCKMYDCEIALRLRSMSEMKRFIMNRLTRNYDYGKDYHYVQFLSHEMHSSLYASDGMRGLCDDRDYRSFRYHRVDNNRIYKMKASRMFMHLLNETTIGGYLPESVKLWLCEEIQSDWEQHAKRELPPLNDMTLRVDGNFERIYDSAEMSGDSSSFGSCMTDRGRHSFYEGCVKAEAASMLNEAGKIVARCVIFTEVRDDETGEIFRLAERQYAKDCKDALKNDLVRMLINGGHIDGYKKVGAGCGDANSFVDVDGNPMSNRKLSIECNLDYDDLLSYQDSFKWYDMDENRAYNYPKGSADMDLSTTDEHVQGCNWDSWNDRWTNDELVSVRYCGRWYSCSEYDLDSFIYIEGVGYVHEEEVDYCPHCEQHYLSDDGVYSSITESSYCSCDCMDEAEELYKHENWHWSEYDEEYFEDEDDITQLMTSADDSQTISVESANYLVRSNQAICIDGVYYDMDYAREALGIC